MITRIINMDQWPEWNRKIFTEDLSAGVIGINREHPNYQEAIAILDRKSVV